MAPLQGNSPSGDGRSDALRVLRPVLVALAACVIAFCGWSAWEYSQGEDPLAFLGGAFQTVEEGSGDQGAIELSPAGDAAESQADEADGTTDDQGAEPADEAQPDEGAQADSATSGSASSGSGTSSVTSGSANAGSSAGSGSTGSGGSPNGSASGSQSSGSGSGPSSSVTSPSRPARITVSITVDGSRAGAGSSSATLSLAPGSTVYDALAASGVSYNAKSTGYGMYVSSIGGLAEKEHGGMSGWLYSVNGEVPNYACSSYQLSDGDSVYWWYDNVEY